MEYSDVIFKGVKINEIESFLKNDLMFCGDKIIRSHFYSEEKGDFEYYGGIDWSVYFGTECTCNMLVSEIRLNKIFKNVLIIITSDKSSADITLNIEQTQLKANGIDDLTDFLKTSFGQYEVKTEFSNM